MSWKRYLLVRLARVGALALHARVRRFKALCEHPEAVQTELLLRILRRQTPTAFGKDHGFATIQSVADYRRHVPMAPYEMLAPYIERVKAGETSALIADDRVLLFALTSGTTSARKFIPVTDRYLADNRRAWTMWGVKVYREHRPRDLAFRPIVQLVGDPDEFRTSAGIPCGNLSGYTASIQKRIVSRQYIVPTECGKITHGPSRYYIAMRVCLGTPVSWFISANPSTMLTLARTLDSQRELLVRDLHDGTLNKDLEIPDEIRAKLAPRWKPNPKVARTISAMMEKTGRLYPQDLWPANTTFMGTWTGGSMGTYLKQLPQYYGDLPIRDLGLVASEGRFTIPFAEGTSSAVLDIASHYFEFVPEDEIDSPSPTVLGAHELVVGKSYFILPTTAAGLYRYQISDLVRVTGFLNRTPMVEFLGKGNRFANITGEKLSEHHVTQAMTACLKQQPVTIGAYAVAPVWSDTQPYYAIFIEQSEIGDNEAMKAFATSLDDALKKMNIEYESKRSSGRLGPLRIAVIPNGAWAKWDRERLSRTGGSPEQYKRQCLIGDLKFAEGMQVIREVR